MIRVFAVDDHPVVLEGVHRMLSLAAGIEIVGEAEDVSSAMELMAQLRPEVLLLDVRLPGVDGMRATRQLKERFPEMRVLILTVCDDDSCLFESLKAGADGYLLKNCRPKVLIDAICSVASGRKVIDERLIDRTVRELTNLLDSKAAERFGIDRQSLAILRLAADGLTNRQIADTVHLSAVSVQKKLQYIYEKLGVNDRAQAVAVAFRTGLIT